MSQIGQPERITQNRIVQLFREQLNYDYLGNWEDRPNNSNIEEDLLRKFLTGRGTNKTLINRAVTKLLATANNYHESLYTNNKNTYSFLRYGVDVKARASDKYEPVQLIDWKNPEANHFAIAEEVTVFGNHEKRPDIVIYVNGIAVGVLELKRSTVNIGEGIRQNIGNQQKEFIQPFFSTVQFVFAGNDSEGLRYGTIGTREKYFLRWKEGETDEGLYQLDKYLLKMCSKQRLLELIYDFVLFEGGTKKLPRVHQYFAIKAAQSSLRKKEGGIIWHTQGSGKSIVMVLLAKWILENNHKARVAIITDREELDEQIERVFKESGEGIYRTKSGKDLMAQLGRAKPRLLCSLVHKFGKRNVDNFDAFIEELQSAPSKTVGELVVFVDECHRSQGGKLHQVMKALLPSAIFIGFTGTPLLKKDKQTSLEVFGKYIHTYKFNEAVEDEVILDLMYEARDIEQRISSQERIDTWFAAKTSGLNDFQKSELKKKWGTMQRVLSSKNRMQQIVNDIVVDFNTKTRISSDSGNALLVAGSIYEAAKYYELFQHSELRGKCALITSYNPSYRDIVTEDTGENTDTEKEYIYNTYMSLLAGQDCDKYEKAAKSKFLSEPANMKLLIVVDKLLTGFDAPPCTYLYIDKAMQDHGLFQAICRVNRLDTDDKEFGYIVDYKELFTKVEDAVSVYTSELDYDNFNKEDCDIILKDRLTKGRERLDEALESIALVCNDVSSPKTDLNYIRYFCGNPENPEDLKATENRRTALYKHTVSLIRAYANIADEMPQAGYTAKQTNDIKKSLDNYLRLREIIRKASGETLDLKTFEADMRYLIDNFIQASESKRIDPFEGQSLLDLIVNTGIAEAIKKLPEGIRSSKEAVAETIENNIRQKIVKEHLIDPAYFDEMSKLLNTIIAELKQKKISYEQYLKKMADLAKRVCNLVRDDLPKTLQTNEQRALYHNLGNDEKLALRVDEVVKRVKQADWKGDERKENLIKSELLNILHDVKEVERIFPIIKQQREY
ncbi:HsdR family type I site-specific deoxyribonuclease [candidate division TA06 bacterium]|nr:HsdR family type I site-specific deoxyribonuclease [candidate division TA06 bacterium]